MASSVNETFGHALAAFQAGKVHDAERLFKKFLRVHPRHVAGLNLLSILLTQLGKFKEAEHYVRLALKENATTDTTFYNYGIILKALQRPAEALERFNQALAINAAVAETWNNRGTVYNELKRYDDAVADFDKAAALQPSYAAAYCNKGKALTELMRFDEASAAYDKALTLNARLAEAWLGRGRIFALRKRIDDALAAYDKALAFNGRLAEAWLGRGLVLVDLRRLDEAVANFDKALALKPDLIGAEGVRLHAKMLGCDWRNLDAESEQLISAIRSGVRASAPFPLLSVASSASDQLECAKLYASSFPVAPPQWQGERYRHDRIRVAYLSSDFRAHVVAMAIAEVFERHDRTKFETIGISFGVDDGSEMRARIVKSFDRFHDVAASGDREVAELLHRLQIDIAIDLNNCSENSRPGILTHRPAPIQVNYLGVAATMGTASIDYAIADKLVLPSEDHRFWTEKIVSLPDCYHPHDTLTKRTMSSLVPTRAQAGLPNDGFVFCAFNNSYKITPSVFATWMRLLNAIEGSVLWLSSNNDLAAANLRQEARRLGINPERLIFAPKLDRMADHLARQQLADLFLDTLPYNAHTTAADALWAGLPVVTCRGATFPGRVAASFLSAVGLPELIANTSDEYEALALRLARDPVLLAGLKTKLMRNRDSYPLFDTSRFTRHLEKAYTMMWERQQSGEAPQSFAVEPID